MARVEHKVYLEDSDDYVIQYKETEKSKQKQEYMSKFNVDPVNDFVSEVNRKKFGHICNKCKNKKHCKKCIGKIIIKCDDLRR
jgi:hypothetical protein